MSDEGVRFIARIGLVIILILVTAVFRTIIGPGRRRGYYVLFGTLGGISLGVALASIASRWLEVDVSVIGACLGMFFGWGVAWMFARRVPRDAH